MDRGSRAATLWNDKAFKETVAALEAKYTKRILAGATVEEREAAHRQYKALTDVAKELLAAYYAAYAVQHQADEDARLRALDL